MVHVHESDKPDAVFIWIPDHGVALPHEFGFEVAVDLPEVVCDGVTSPGRAMQPRHSSCPPENGSSDQLRPENTPKIPQSIV